METDHNQETQAPVAKSPRGPRWTRWVAIGAITLVGLSGLGLVAAQSDDFGRGMRTYMMHAGTGERGFSERRLGYILDAIKATPEQSEKLRAIVARTRDDMRSTREGFIDARDQFAEILGAPTIDRAAAEKLRAERIQAVDDASKKLTAALLDAAEVLTPEQRAEILQHFKERRAFHRW
ncbi:MAG TPA: Spy/CpxP family protein refolding chaperone [Rhizobiaceae bacterium]|nr:Spy/CpxP family protein refolding chaperone [Rhizobiaceae bacterium]